MVLLETTLWLEKDTEIGPIGDMVGSIRIGPAGQSKLAIHTVLAVDQIALWKRLRDACDEQIDRLMAAQNPLTDNPAPIPHEALVDAMIASGDLGDFPPVELQGVDKMEEEARMPKADEDGHCTRCGYIWQEEGTTDPHECPPGFRMHQITQVVRIPAPLDDIPY